MRYTVTARNEETGEEAQMQVETEDIREAMGQVLCQLFHERGWRKATALRAREVRVSDAA